MPNYNTVNTEDTNMLDNTSNLIAIISHEFKTPLTAIASAADLIASKLHIDNYMDPLYKKNISKITTEIFKLNSMLDEILTMSNIISNSIEIKKELTDVYEILEELKAQYFTDRKDARTFKIKVSGTHVKIYADKKQLSTIFSNLLNNALKFSNKKMPVATLQYDEHALLIHIEDDGIGIPPGDLPHLFQPFYRGSNVDSIEGTGLGLHIVKTFVTANNGKILLPVNSIQEPHSPSNFHIPDMNSTILLIEDKPGLLDTVQSLLELHDYAVITATNGQEGVQLARTHHPDLVISDIYMPVLNGYQLLEQFQQDEQLSKIPVIILSAKTAEEEINMAYQKGAAGYVIKPFLFASLHENIKKLLT